MSGSPISQHMAERHGPELGTGRRVPRASEDVEPRPRILYRCAQCNFVAPVPGDAIIKHHIESAHPVRNGPTSLSFCIVDDEAEIERFVRDRWSKMVWVCNYPECECGFGDELTLTAHWIDEHAAAPVEVDEVRAALDSDTEGLRLPLSACFAEWAESQNRRQPITSSAEDGYRIRHSPNVPRIRSSARETIIYIERTTAGLPQEEFDDLLSLEGWDSDEGRVVDQWGTARFALRFCNIEDGYLPLIKDARSILPPILDDGYIQVSWQSEHETFECKVSKSKRAIYNLQGYLRKLFRGLDSGVFVYLSREGEKKYRLHLKRQIHVVPTCKSFYYDGNRWQVEMKSEIIEWESCDHVFRHQMTFHQMEALREEARRVNMSIRDAVYEVMKRAPPAPVRVLAVYEEVFWRLRTCSLAAVWAQFRPEHECYERVGRGVYRFNPLIPLPTLRTVEAHREEGARRSARQSVLRGQNTRIRVIIHWSKMDARFRDRADEVIHKRFASQTMAHFAARLIEVFGPEMSERLERTRVSGRCLFSQSPKVDFVNQLTGKLYGHQWIPGSPIHILTHFDNPQKCDHIRNVVAQLSFRADSVDVSIVPGYSRASLLDLAQED